MIKIMIADDHTLIRDGLKALIEKQSNMQVIAEASDGQAAVRTARKVCPDVIVMDVGMPDLNGIEATRQISVLPGKPKIVGLSMHSDRRYISQMLKAGAAGYLLKDSAFEELVKAISTVTRGQIYLSPQIAETVVDDYRRNSTSGDGSVFSLLTTREREVLQQISEGCSTKEIASTLCVSVKTIETHRRQIMEKLKLRSVAELTKYAVKEGLTELDG